jgi:hypothetical protein
MKIFCLTILLIFWLLFTVILSISIFGALFAFLIEDQYGRSEWFKMGKILYETIIG